MYNMPGLIARSVEIARDDGLVSLALSSKEYIYAKIKDQRLKYEYKKKYGDIAPRPDERLWIDPQNIDYTISSEDMYEDNREYPGFGILGGPWDQHKNYWRESVVWAGLKERFEEGKPWEETSYYQFSMEKLKSGESIGYLDGPQTVENFEGYLDVLDELYKSLKQEGYDPSSVITVHVGRDGEWIASHGNHRRTIASIVGIESVLVRVKFRHRKWQDIRRRFYEADSIEEVRDVQQYLNHPDIPDVTSA